MCASIRPVAIDDCFEVVPASLRLTTTAKKLEFLISFPNFFWYSFIDVYCAKTIMEICYALGAMKKIFMAFLLLSTTRCIFFSFLFAVLYATTEENLLQFKEKFPPYFPLMKLRSFSFYLDFFFGLKRSSIWNTKEKLLFFKLN